MLGRPDDVRSSGKTGSGRHLAKLTRLTQLGQSHAVDMLVALVDKARLLSQSRQLF